MLMQCVEQFNVEKSHINSSNLEYYKHLNTQELKDSDEYKAKYIKELMISILKLQNNKIINNIIILCGFKFPKSKYPRIPYLRNLILKFLYQYKPIKEENIKNCDKKLDKNFSELLMHIMTIKTTKDNIGSKNCLEKFIDMEQQYNIPMLYILKEDYKNKYHKALLTESINKDFEKEFLEKYDLYDIANILEFLYNIKDKYHYNSDNIQYGQWYKMRFSYYVNNCILMAYYLKNYPKDLQKSTLNILANILNLSIFNNTEYSSDYKDILCAIACVLSYCKNYNESTENTQEFISTSLETFQYILIEMPDMINITLKNFCDIIIGNVYFQQEETPVEEKNTILYCKKNIYKERRFDEKTQEYKYNSGIDITSKTQKIKEYHEELKEQKINKQI